MTAAREQTDLIREALDADPSFSGAAQQAVEAGHDALDSLTEHLAQVELELREKRALLASNDPAASLARERLSAYEQRTRLEDKCDSLTERLERYEQALRRRIDECGCGEEEDGTWCVWCAEDSAALEGKP